MLRLALLPVLAAPLLFGGCVLLDPTDPYAGMSAYRLYAGAASRPAATWPIQGPLTLDESIRVALANNPELLATAREVDAAAAQRDMVAGQRLPSLHVTGGYNHYLDSQRLTAAQENGEAGVFSRNIFAGDIVVSLPLLTGGRITSEVKAAELLQKSAEHRLSRTREEIVFNVSSVFYSILVQRRVIESLEFSKKALQEHLKQVKDLLAAQKAAKVDQLRTEVRLADLEQRLVKERNVLAIQARVLTNLLGLDSPEKPVEPAGELVFVQATIPEVESALRDAFGGRADYLAARAALEAQAKTVDAARAAYWPTISLQGAYGGRWAADPTEQQAGSSTSGDVGRVGVVVDIPIFEGGRVNARIRQEKARLLAAQERLRRLQLQIHLDIETAVLNISSSAERVKATEKAVEQAKESLRIEREKYDLGKGAIVDVLDAQSAVLESQMNYYRALADLNIAIAQMKLATGEKLK